MSAAIRGLVQGGGGSRDSAGAECRGLEASLDRIEAIFRNAGGAPASDAAAEAAAVGAFIAGWVPILVSKRRRVADQVVHPPLGSPIDALTHGQRCSRRRSTSSRRKSTARLERRWMH